MNNKLGVMQGRLLPKYINRYQAHPVGCWQDEFILANDIKLDCIEFILDYNDFETNPLLMAGGVQQIKDCCIKTGVEVHSICADYFMEAPIHAEVQKDALRSIEVMVDLLHNASELGVSDIVIPCVDSSSLKIDSNSGSRFVKQMAKVLPTAEKLNINLSLETDLPPKLFIELLDCFNSENVTVNYDIGNSAALGFDPLEELNAYGHKISDIHIKDRTYGGGPVILGSGEAQFQRFFSKLKDFDFKGPFIMQAYRDDEGVEVFKKQLAWIKPYLEDFGMNFTNIN